MTTHLIELEHTTDTGHRIPGHQGGAGKCARLHGHTYHFRVGLSSDVLDDTGMVVDFGDVKDVLNAWDHRLLLWVNDPLFEVMNDAFNFDPDVPEGKFPYGLIPVPFIPTAENMARHLVTRFVTEFTQVAFAYVEVRETPKSLARCQMGKQEARQMIVQQHVSAVPPLD